MKKILSLALVGVMTFSALPMAYAAETQDYTLGSNVAVIGDAASEYEVKVPARLEAGASGNVVATGTWKSNETLVVTADEVIEVTNEETGATTKVVVVFEGIEAAGNDLAAMNITKTVTVEKGDILFGTWTGIVEYDVDLIAPKTFTIDGKTYNYLEDMSLKDWVNSEYNTDGYKIVKEGNTEYIANADESAFLCILSGGVYYRQQATAAFRVNEGVTYSCSATYQ